MSLTWHAAENTVMQHFEMSSIVCVCLCVAGGEEGEGAVRQQKRLLETNIIGIIIGTIHIVFFSFPCYCFQALNETPSEISRKYQVKWLAIQPTVIRKTRSFFSCSSSSYQQTDQSQKKWGWCFSMWTLHTQWTPPHLARGTEEAKTCRTTLT